MEKILVGIERFEKEIFPERKELFEKLAHGQTPTALFLTCADSRVDPSLLTQTDPGDLFICRNAGNIVPPHTGETGGMTASIEYAVAVLNIPHIIICGHTKCGAMGGAMAPDSLDALPHVKKWLTYSDAAKRTVEERDPSLSDEEKLHALIEENVLSQLQNLRTHPYVAARVASGKLELHGWVYEIETGRVLIYDDETKAFAPGKPKVPSEHGTTLS